MGWGTKSSHGTFNPMTMPVPLHLNQEKGKIYENIRNIYRNIQSLFPPLLHCKWPLPSMAAPSPLPKGCQGCMGNSTVPFHTKQATAYMWRGMGVGMWIQSRLRHKQVVGGMDSWMKRTEAPAWQPVAQPPPPPPHPPLNQPSAGMGRQHLRRGRE